MILKSSPLPNCNLLPPTRIPLFPTNWLILQALLVFFHPVTEPVAYRATNFNRRLIKVASSIHVITVTFTAIIHLILETFSLPPPCLLFQ